MKTSFLRNWILGAIILGAFVRCAVGDVSGSYSGQITPIVTNTSLPVTAMLTQAGNRLSGTLTISTGDPRLMGVYALRGHANSARFSFFGTTTSRARLTAHGSVAGALLSGSIHLTGRSVRVRGTLSLGLPPPPTPAGSSGSGAQLFTSTCSGCHGLDARGRIGPDIRCNRAIHDTVRNGRSGSIGVMPAFAGMSDADIAAIQGFLVGLCPVPSGADLFLGNCAGCHGADAAGQPGRPNIQCTVRSRIYNAVRNGRGSGLMPVFASSTLSNTAVDSLAAYLGTLCDGSPGARFASNCATCHGPTGGGSVNADGIRGPNMRCTGTNDFLEKVQFGSDGMPPFPEIAVSEITGIASYVQQNFCPLGGD